MGVIAKLLGDILGFVYKNIIPNYGVAIIIFTIFIRLLLLPLNIKQQKSTARMQKISPLLTEINNKYKNDKEKASQETMKLYKEYKISPLAGCLPMLLQFPILIALIWVIYDPGWYMFGVDTANAVNTITAAAGNPTLAKLMFAVQECGLNATFLGIDLVAIPDFRMASVSWIFPLLSTAATFWSGKLTQNQTASSGAGNDTAAQTSKMMTTMFPLMTLFFTFTMPVAASFYWFLSSLLQIVQTIALKRIVKVNDLVLKDGGTWHERNSKKRKNG